MSIGVKIMWLLITTAGAVANALDGDKFWTVLNTVLAVFWLVDIIIVM